MGKNIVVFSDGTGQEGGNGNDTNVYKLFNMVLDRTPEQVAFYDRGLGTGWRRLTGSAVGAGFSRNVQECYQFIFENYQAGDRIYLFGFSRGAATVRSLSGFMHLFGILPKSRPELIGRAYDIYEIGDREEREVRARAFVDRHKSMWTRIRFLGVWDTVAALGVPIRSVDMVIDRLPFLEHRFHDFRLSKTVENAYHALAIDDERETFHPVLWDPEIDDSYQTMKQVWFCGMHTDVGGGYREPQLSDIALEWMLVKATECGLLIYPNHKVTLDPLADGMMHDSRGTRLTRLYRRAVRAWPAGRSDRICIHESVLKRKLNRANGQEPNYDCWILKAEGGYDVEPWVRYPPERQQPPGPGPETVRPAA